MGVGVRLGMAQLFYSVLLLAVVVTAFKLKPEQCTKKIEVKDLLLQPNLIVGGLKYTGKGTWELFIHDGSKQSKVKREVKLPDIKDENAFFEYKRTHGRVFFHGPDSISLVTHTKNVSVEQGRKIKRWSLLQNGTTQDEEYWTLGFDALNLWYLAESPTTVYHTANCHNVFSEDEIIRDCELGQGCHLDELSLYKEGGRMCVWDAGAKKKVVTRLPTDDVVLYASSFCNQFIRMNEKMIAIRYTGSFNTQFEEMKGESTTVCINIGEYSQLRIYDTSWVTAKKKKEYDCQPIIPFTNFSTSKSSNIEDGSGAAGGNSGSPVGGASAKQKSESSSMLMWVGLGVAGVVVVIVVIIVVGWLSGGEADSGEGDGTVAGTGNDETQAADAGAKPKSQSAPPVPAV